MLIYGAKPGYGVRIDTKLIRDAMICFQELYEKDTQIVQVPDALDSLIGSDANIEIVTSSILQPTRIHIKAKLAI